MTITGECFCGAISYRIDGPLKNARSCHCSRCRRAFGGQASAYAEVEPGTFQWLTGSDLLAVYNSGPDFGHSFCSRCGSLLAGMYRGDVHGVGLGCVNGDPGIDIEYHLYVGSKASWEVLPEGVRMYDKAPPADEAGYP